MAKQKSLKLNFIMNALLTVSSFLFSFIAFPYVSRVLLPEGIGKVSFAISLISYFNVFAQLGIPAYGISICAKIRDNREELTRTSHELLMINLITGMIAYMALFTAVMCIPKLRAEKTLYMVLSTTIFLSAVGMEWIYRALEQYFYITVSSVIFKITALAAMVLLINSQKDYIIFGGMTVFASSASYVINLFYLHKFIDMRPIGNYNLRRHFKAVGVFFAMACATTIYTHFDTVMLGFMRTDEDVGYYNAAVQIKAALVSVVTSLGAVLLPRSSYYVQQGQLEAFRAISKKAIQFVCVVACPLTIFFVMFARQEICFLSGEAYAESVWPMKIIMPTLLLIGLSNITGLQILIPLGREKVVLYSELTGAAVDFLLNVLLIPRYAASGAAFGTLVAELAVLVVQCAALRNEAGELFRIVPKMKIAAALALGIGASVWVLKAGWSNFLTLLIGAVLFFFTYFLCLLYEKEPLVREMMGQILKRWKKG